MPDDGTVESIVDENGIETVIDEDGQRYEVVKGYTNHDDFTPGQQRVIGDIYIRMAQELPTEGRDYIVKFEFAEGNNTPRLSLKAMTELGQAYIRHLSKALARG